MWSSKSTELLALFRKYRAIKKAVLLINHASDTRYAKDGISTHDGILERCHMVDTMAQVLALPDYAGCQVVLINEGQFFPDLVKVLTSECDRTDKTFVVAGLSGGYSRQPVGDILMLIPHAETVQKLEGLCQDCRDGTPGCFTKRKRPIREGESAVGGGEQYKCVCRRHYIQDEHL
jgi:thymidine kinase